VVFFKISLLPTPKCATVQDAMISLPLDVISKWPPPNYDNPVTRSVVDIWLVKMVFIVLALFCVSLRLWLRVHVRRWFGVDDVLISLAMVIFSVLNPSHSLENILMASKLCAVAVSVLVSIGTANYEWDRHLWDFRPELRVGE
jgi:hypothetical protein